MAEPALAHDLILGRYRAVRPLGSGGMGHVWLARDEQSGLDVALKMVVREGRAGERAEREARAAAALRHPRCQRIYAMARDANHVYIAYEYIPGRTLREALTTPGLDDAEAIEVAAQVLEALAHAHGRGIVHRDVKPSNILLGEAAEIDVRLLDFGLAQMAEFDTLTAVGDVPGTLAYVSPERLKGENATAAADIWAVGVMLWEALTGRHPFRGQNAEGTQRRIRSGAPPLDTIRPDLPRPLLDLVSSALELDPGRRPSAAHLASDLREAPRKRRRRVEPETTRPRRRKSRAAAPARERDQPGADAGRSRTPETSRPVAIPRRSPLQRLAGASVLSFPEVAARVPPAAAAAVWTGWATSTLAFYPEGWPAALTFVVALAGLALPRLALPLALTVSFFPLANISLGLAIVFGCVGLAWTVLSWNDPRSNAVLVAGPLLGPLGALALIPLVAQLAAGPVRKGLQSVAAVLLAVVVAGMGHTRLPFEGSVPPLGLGITGSSRPGAVAWALIRMLEAHPVVLAEAGALGLVAAVLPALRGRGPWGAVLAGGTLLALTALIAPSAALVPLIAAAWLTAGVVALESAALGSLRGEGPAQPSRGDAFATAA